MNDRDMTLQSKANLLTEYIESLPNFKLVAPEVPYYHMGATITDAILQAGVKYETVVFPRVQAIKNQYPEARTTTGFLGLLTTMDPRKLINWNHSEKIDRIIGVTNFFATEGVETEKDLGAWLQNAINIERLKRLRGIGSKTADYFKILAGLSTSAVDRHLIQFLNQAGINISIVQYLVAQQIIKQTADQMQIEACILDHSIWKYMSGGQTTGSRIKKYTKNCLKVGD